MNDEKRFFVTEKQLNELKKLLERYEGMPKDVSLDEDFIDDEDIPIIEPMVESSVEAALAEPNRDLKFWIEDVEGQESDDPRWRKQSEEPAPKREIVLRAWKQKWSGEWLYGAVRGERLGPDEYWRSIDGVEYWRPIGGAPA